jgi:hypothetical protein
MKTITLCNSKHGLQTSPFCDMTLNQLIFIHAVVENKFVVGVQNIAKFVVNLFKKIVLLCSIDHSDDTAYITKLISHNSEDGGRIFLRNIGIRLQNYMLLRPRIPHYEQSSLWKPHAFK